MRTEREPEEEQEQYSFIEEVIKEEHIETRILLRKIGIRILLGGTLGIAAALGFTAFRPWAKEMLEPDASTVEIQYEVPGSMESVESWDGGSQPENYTSMLQEIRRTATDAEKCVVQVINLPEEARWDDSPKDKGQKTSGLIVADNGYKLLILVNDLDLEQPRYLQVVFQDGTAQEASVVQRCNNIGIAVISVEKNAVDKQTLKGIRIASWGNSNALEKDATLIALGAPHGYEGGLSYEILKSAREQQVCADGVFPILIVQSGFSHNSTGFLFDLYGNVIGIIDSQLAAEREALAAWGISALKQEVGLMLNEKPVPYIGVIGTWVSPEMEEKLNMPKGIYVKSVETDSPAMRAGIQTGDIITDIDEMPINSLIGYHNQVMIKEVGQQIQINGVRFGAEEYVAIAFDVMVGVKK